jgi:hypothetical protein
MRCSWCSNPLTPTPGSRAGTIDGDIDLASPFGVRTDPFNGSPAMHTGIDLHGETGEAVRATADGTVTSAGWSGGVLAELGVDVGKAAANGVGGPFGLWPGDRRRPRQRIVHALRAPLGDRRACRPDRADRADHRQGRLDRALDRPASALRDAGARRGGRPAEVPARRRAPRRQPLIVDHSCRLELSSARMIRFFSSP